MRNRHEEMQEVGAMDVVQVRRGMVHQAGIAKRILGEVHSMVVHKRVGMERV